MLFNPSRNQVRQFFINAWQRRNQPATCTPLEQIALQWMAQHPEYFALLEDPHAAERDYPDGVPHSNPFLHLSLHLSVAEQLSIDQPPGIRAIFATLASKLGDDHRAAHAVMDCLSDIIWQAQQTRQTPDSATYLMQLQRLATAE